MSSSTNKLAVAISAVLALTLPTISNAADISHAIRGTSQADTINENYFEIGLGYTWHKGPSSNPRNLDWTGGYGVVNFSYNFNGFFVERFADKFSQSTDPIVFGYNAYNNDNWSFDVTLNPKNGGITLTDRIRGGENDGQRIDILKRDSDLMLGGRLTGYFGNNILQFSVNQDVNTHYGRMASALIGRNWQIRNWNFHGLLGVQYFDADTNDYYKGISEAEAAHTTFTPYEAGGGFNFNAEVGVTYPITKDWVYRATAGVVKFSDEQLNSPLYHGNRSTSTTFSTSLSYVF